MKLKKTKISFPAIHEMGRKISQLSQSTGKEYLFLHRGINSVVNIDIDSIVKGINFNACEMQVYPPVIGREPLRKAINNEYFDGQGRIENISICGGGMPGIDIAFQIVETKKIYLPVYHWGNYHNAMSIHGIGVGEYETIDDLYHMLPELKGNAMIIGDPGNPLGNKYKADESFELIKTVNDNDTVVFYDSPYRRVFYDNNDCFYKRLIELKNVIILDSFSKSLGLSGQRLGFVHSIDADFNKEIAIRLAYSTNGTNVFSQILIEKLLTTPEGRKSIDAFKRNTVDAIKKNIEYLGNAGFIANNLYNNHVPIGIFAIVNISEEELLDNMIGSVSLAKFTLSRKEEAAQYSRI